MKELGFSPAMSLGKPSCGAFFPVGRVLFFYFLLFLRNPAVSHHLPLEVLRADGGRTLSLGEACH
ncbi:MAG: hypothetical protein QHH30_00640, partial [candidate division NC10 bacterium]|nr:hypothetical protein [candidate division NC10 bacterium]